MQALQTRHANSAPTVVGYQGAPQYKFTLSGPTFTPVAGSEATVKLGSVTVNTVVNNKGRVLSGWDYDGDVLAFFDATGKQSHFYKNLPQCLIDVDEDLEGKTAGWYSSSDLSYSDCLNGEDIPFGTGFYVNAPSQLEENEPNLVYAGQVKATPAETPVYKFTLACNSTPVRINLGQMTVNTQVNNKGRVLSGWDYDGDVLAFFDATGKQSHFYKNLPQCLIDVDEDLEGKTAGWYGSSDLSYSDCLNGEGIEAGAGFYVNAPSQLEENEPSLILPSALPQEEAAE